MNMMEHMSETVTVFWYCVFVCLAAWTVAFYVKAFTKWIAGKIRKLLKKDTNDNN